MQKEKRPLVSIIITTKNEDDVISRLLKSIVKQSYQEIETIIVDNNSTDQTIAIARKFPVTIYTRGPERSSQRNFGVKHARGKYVLILDADMELTSGVIKECVDLMSHDSAVKALVIPERSIAVRFWEKVKAYERSFYNDFGDTTIEAARFFEKKVFLKLGGYDTTLTGPEDWDLPERVRMLGHKIGRIEALIYHYERIPSLIFLVRKKYYYALSSHRYLKKHKINVLSAKTIYFLRPTFYKQWHKLFSHPILSLAMISMFIMELLGGALGYFIGKLRNG